VADLGRISQYQTSNLPQVSDPEAVYAAITRRDYDRYMRDFRPFEERLLEARNDTSLIDRARSDSANQARIAAGVRQRNLERYGGAGLSAAQLQEQERAQQRAQSLGTVGAINNARLAQREINQSTLADLINIGQGVNRSALSNMGNAASMANQRYNAYKNAKAQHSAQMMGIGGQLGSALLAAFMI